MDNLTQDEKDMILDALEASELEAKEHADMWRGRSRHDYNKEMLDLMKLRFKLEHAWGKVMYLEEIDSWEEAYRELTEAWNLTYGDVRLVTAGNYEYIELTTGGWSDNELQVESLRKSPFWYRYWFSSQRGGKEVFRRDLV